MTIIKIRDRELGEEVATVRADGEYDAETPLAEEVLSELLDTEDGLPYMGAREDEGGNIVEFAQFVQPGDEGFLAVLSECLDWPLEAVEPEGGFDWPPDPDASEV